MRISFSPTHLPAIVAVIALCLLCFMCQIFFPFQIIYYLGAGWAHYLFRVLPEIQLNLSALATAGVCLIGLAVGLHLFLRWLHRQRAIRMRLDSPSRTWAFRWSLSLLGLVLLMFVAGTSAVGISHQTAWLVTSPEPRLGRSMRDGAGRMSTGNNLRYLALALHNHHDHQETLPASMSVDDEGRPLLSWRVHVLQYLEEEALYREFRLDEPWDSPHNLALLPRMPNWYAHPLADASTARYETHFQVIIGPGAAFEGQKRLRLKEDFTDDHAKTILVVEARDPVPWTKPQDLPYSPHGPVPRLGGHFRGLFVAAMADGGMLQLEDSLDEQTLRALITRSGGDRPKLD